MRAHAISEPLVRDACVLHRLSTTSPAYWQGWNRLRAQTGAKFYTLFDAVSRVMANTPRSGALLENLHSRLRSYFTPSLGLQSNVRLVQWQRCSQDSANVSCGWSLQSPEILNQAQQSFS